MLHQTIAVCGWNLWGIRNRLPNALVVVISFFAVIVVLSTVLAVRDGVALSAARPGADTIAVVTAWSGTLDMRVLDTVRQMPGIARNGNGPMAAGTAFSANLIRDWRPGMLGIAVVLGIEGRDVGVLPNFRILEGRMFRPGLDEMMIGKGALQIFPEYAPGRSMEWHHRQWKMVGVFATGSSVQDTEFLADLRQAQGAINKGNGYSGILARLTSPAAFDGFKKSLERQPGLALNVVRLSDQDNDMGKQIRVILTLVAAVITLLMAVGAIFAALNIMYASIASRSGELAVLRALGFSRLPILVAVLSEPMMLALIGGGLGILVAVLLFNGFETSTIMGARQVSFQFAVTPSAAATALILTLGMGLVGGLLPAIRAARQPIAAALREE